MVAVAVGQFSATEDTSTNLDVIRRFAAQAREADASVLVLPEYSSYTPARFDQRIIDHAEPLDGAFASAMGDIAAAHHLAVVVGMIEAIPSDDHVHNTLLLIGPDGGLAGAYRKLHLYDAFGFRESDRIAPGAFAQPPVLDLDGIRLGAQTCYDLRFPESTRVLVDVGVDVVLVPAQWIPGPCKEDHWSTLLRARAIENTVYVAGAGQSAPSGSGTSMIVDPMGIVVAGLGDRVGIAIARIDPDRIEHVRSTNPVLRARRFRVEPR